MVPIEISLGFGEVGSTPSVGSVRITPTVTLFHPPPVREWYLKEVSQLNHGEEEVDSCPLRLQGLPPEPPARQDLETARDRGCSGACPVATGGHSAGPRVVLSILCKPTSVVLLSPPSNQLTLPFPCRDLQTALLPSSFLDFDVLSSVL